jgi:hypothetical protein
MGVTELVPPSRLADALSELPRRPELLLFLRRVRVLSVSVQPSIKDLHFGKSRGLIERMRRRVDETLPLSSASIALGYSAAVATVVVESTTSHTGVVTSRHHRWLLLHSSVSLASAPSGVVPPAALSSAGVSTTLTLAFTVPDGTSDTSPSALLYAFLPVARFGLRFTLNADWMLSTTREALLSGLSWNRWLSLSVFPSAFLAAREMFVAAAGAGLFEPAVLKESVSATNGCGDEVSAVISTTSEDAQRIAALAWLRALPIAAELRSQHDGGLFAAAAAAISAAAQDVACLPRLGGGWVSPARAVCVTGSTVSSLGIRPAEFLSRIAELGVSPRDVASAVPGGLELVDTDSSGGVPERVLVELRVTPWRTSVSCSA